MRSDPSSCHFPGEPSPAAPLPELVRRLLAGLARSRPLEELCGELAISLAKGRQIVAKLVRIGVLGAPDPAAFSEAEEAFFASEVQVDPWEEEAAPAGLWARARSLVAALTF